MTGLENLWTAERRACGHVIVLPGIEGHSRWNRSVVRGLQEAGLPYAIEIHDWTFGRMWSLWSLRSTHRHREQSQLIADKVIRSRREHPDAPLWLIGHSGGGAMALLTLALLPADVKVTGAVLLAPAISPTYDLAGALSHTNRGLWNFSSWGDWFFLIMGTTLMGTLDGRHTISAGARGFCPPNGTTPSARSPDAVSQQTEAPRLVEVPWRREMLTCRNLAGHFGCVHSAFIRDWVAPILAGEELPQTAH